MSVVHLLILLSHVSELQTESKYFNRKKVTKRHYIFWALKVIGSRHPLVSLGFDIHALSSSSSTFVSFIYLDFARNRIGSE